MVADLVYHGLGDLGYHLLAGVAVVQDRQSVDRDAVGLDPGVPLTALGQRGIGARRTNPALPAYGATKRALNSLTGTAAVTGPVTVSGSTASLPVAPLRR